MKSLFKKIIVVSLVAAFTVAPFIAHAQLGGLGSVPVQLNGEGLIGGITSTGTELASNSCLAAETVASNASGLLTTGLNLLGDNPAQLAGLQAQIGIIDTAIGCWNGILTGGTTGGTIVGSDSSLFGFTKKNAYNERAVDQITALKATRKQIEARIQVASQGFWKAVLVGLLLKQTDQLSEKLVSDLTEKFKINNYAQYVGAVADTVYVNSMILRHVDNDQDRAIVRSMITNPLLKKGIHPAIQAAADAYVGGSVTQGRFDDPQWANKLGRDAAGEEYKTQYQSAMISKTDEVIAKAREAASLEVQQSGGYKSTLNNCGPTISEQKQKDAQYNAILAEINDRQSLSRAISSANNSTAVEKAQVEADIKNANSKLANFTQIFGVAVTQICEGVNTPAVKFKDTIHDLIGSQIKNFTDYNDNNLPFFQKLVVEIADNLINKFVFGKEYSKGDLLNDATGSLTAGIAGTLGQPSASTSASGTLGSASANPVGNVSIYARNSSGSQGAQTSTLVAGQKYIITIDFSGIADESPYRVNISGIVVDGGTNNLTLSPADLSAKKVQFDYTADNKAVTLSATFYARPAPGTTGDVPIGPYSQRFSSGGVAGASIVLPRGPALSFR